MQRPANNTEHVLAADSGCRNNQPVRNISAHKVHRVSVLFDNDFNMSSACILCLTVITRLLVHQGTRSSAYRAAFTLTGRSSPSHWCTQGIVLKKWLLPVALLDRAILSYCVAHQVLHWCFYCVNMTVSISLLLPWMPHCLMSTHKANTFFFSCKSSSVIWDK